MVKLVICLTFVGDICLDTLCREADIVKCIHVRATINGWVNGKGNYICQMIPEFDFAHWAWLPCITFTCPSGVG